MKTTLVLIGLIFVAFEAFLRGFDSGKAIYQCHEPHPFRGGD